jgi:hypothetical protein
MGVALLAASAMAQSKGPTARRYQISGRTVNAITGNPVAGAEIAIGEATKPESLQSTTSAADGRFAFPDVARGKYWLIAEGKGFRRQGFEEHQGYFTGIAVGPGLPSGDVEFRLQADAAIEGVLTDEENDPVREAQVLVFRSGVEDGRRVTVLEQQGASDDTGHYRVPHLAPGSYYVAVTARPWYASSAGAGKGGTFTLHDRIEDKADKQSPEPARSALDVAYATQFYPGTSDANSATAIALKAGDRATADFNLVAVPALRLHLHPPSGEAGPFGAGLEQRLEGTAMPVSFEQSARRGEGSGQEILLTGIAAGEYTLSVRSFGDRPTHWTEILNLTSDADLTLPAAPASVSLKGVVKFAGDSQAPVRPAIRLLNVTTREEFATQISSKGEFDFQGQGIRAGTYEVSVINAQSAALSSLQATGAKVAGDNITLGAEAARLEVVASQALGQVDGTALRDSTPSSGAMIVLLPQDYQNHTQLVRRDQSDSDGTFSLRNVAPGKYTVLAIQDGWDLEWQTTGVLDPYRAKGTEIRVTGDARQMVKVQVQ